MQRTFNPIDYTFEFTEDWYKWDRKKAHSLALKARNKWAKEMKTKGYEVRKWTHKNSLMSRGGIGSGHPHIELHVNVYGADAIPAYDPADKFTWDEGDIKVLS